MALPPRHRGAHLGKLEKDKTGVWEMDKEAAIGAETKWQKAIR